MCLVCVCFRDFVKSNKGKEKALSEVQFNALAALIEAGPNSSHVGLMWNFTDHAVSLDLFFKVCYYIINTYAIYCCINS